MDDSVVVANGQGQVTLLVDEGVQSWQAWQAWVAAAAAAVAAEEDAYRQARPWEVAVRLADNNAVHELNRTFRAKDKPTNVLSFPNEDDGLDERWYVGDVILAQGVVEAEAAAKGVPLAAYVQHLVVHGLLHLVGYDHMTDDDAVTMQDMETRVLATLGVADPYGDDPV